MKSVYFFGGDKTEGEKEMKEVLGGKGANLAEMCNLGVPVPPGFTISTSTCKQYYDSGEVIPGEVMVEVKENLKKLEGVMGAGFGDSEKPLLLSVRSGAVASMPGMMNTVLNLGLNDEVVQGLIRKTGNERFVWDSYRRFINMFGDVVLGVDHRFFEEILDKKKASLGISVDTDLSADDLKQVSQEYRVLVEQKTGKPFPVDPFEQLELSIKAVFGSWNTGRAKHYRKMHGLHDLVGTAVNVQAMVFGNMNKSSGTGVCFTRDPSTGDNVFYGEYLLNAQGEDVVAGIRNPKPIKDLQQDMPSIYEELVSIYKKLEAHYKDMQDIEFTIQEGKLYILQTRNGKRTAQASVKIAIDMCKEGLLSEEEAILRVNPEQLDHLLHKQLDPVAKEKHSALGIGLPASPGAAVGKVAFCNDSAVSMKKQGHPVILVRSETSPEDLIGMEAAQGILTSRGGMTSHAAVVARGMGKCCVSGCSDAKVSEKDKTLVIGNETFREGDYVTLDGSKGEVFKGKIPTVDPELSGAFGELMSWADKHRSLGVRTNADTPRDAAQAISFGAEGIGLCRTEHMFFEGDRIRAVREMILSDSKESREKALFKLKPFQKKDFFDLFKIMNGRPITIRLLDPPLHEFLPKNEEDINALSEEMGVSLVDLRSKIDSLHEVNPMLGHRGCRLGVSYPEITRMQAEAIFEAARDSVESGVEVKPEIMIPLISDVEELRDQKKVVLDAASKVLGNNSEVKFLVGTMIEVPRAALTSDKIGVEADFFSFGTNDLTQMAFGFSRDDVGSFVPDYLEKKILVRDPFQVLDQEGVGQLVKTSVSLGKSTNKDLKLGICGEHGGDPSSVEFCHRAGLDYVSCSPFRVPIARLAAAQAALKNK